MGHPVYYVWTFLYFFSLSLIFRLFAMLSSGKNQDLSKGFDIAFSDILLCTISYTQTTYLHTIRVSDNKSRVNSIILVVTAISTKILPIIQIWGCSFFHVLALNHRVVHRGIQISNMDLLFWTIRENLFNLF